MTGLLQLRAVQAGRKPGIGMTLQFSGVEFEEGFAAFKGVPGEHAYNSPDTVHGGYAARPFHGVAAAGLSSKHWGCSLSHAPAA